MLLHVSSVYTFTIYFTWRILLCTKKFLIKLDLLWINGISRIPRFMHTVPVLLIFWTLMPVDASRSIIARSRIPSHSSRISSKSSSEYVFAGFNLVYPSYWAFDNIVLVFQPGEKAGQYSADIIYCDLADFTFSLILIQIDSQIVSCNLNNVLADLFHGISDRWRILPDSNPATQE